MIRMMIKKADFSVCQQMQQNIYKIMFAREDVYDEPTERELFSRLLAARPHDTILLITHRPSVADICDHQWRL